jgi:hypothetical protein
MDICLTHITFNNQFIEDDVMSELFGFYFEYGCLFIILGIIMFAFLRAILIMDRNAFIILYFDSIVSLLNTGAVLRYIWTHNFNKENDEALLIKLANWVLLYMYLMAYQSCFQFNTAPIIR